MDSIQRFQEITKKFDIHQDVVMMAIFDSKSNFILQEQEKHDGQNMYIPHYCQSTKNKN